MSKSKSNKILDAILTGIRKDPPSDKMLRHAYWELVTEYRVASTEWTRLMDAYVRIPKYGDTTENKFRDRSQRLTTALTGGSNPSKQPEFTWKRFIEGLVVLDVDTLTVAVSAKRGKWGSKKIVRYATSPKADREVYAQGKVDEYRPSPTSKLISEYFSDTNRTAKRTMEHVLLKILWGLFDEYGLKKSMWEMLVHKYVHDTANCAQLQNRRNDKKNNLQRAITYKRDLTWNRFLESLKVVDIREVEIVFTTARGTQPLCETVCEIDLTKLCFKSGEDDDSSGS